MRVRCRARRQYVRFHSKCLFHAGPEHRTTDIGQMNSECFALPIIKQKQNIKWNRTVKRRAGKMTDADINNGFV